MASTTKALILITALFLFASTSLADSVLLIKNDKALIESSSLSPGDKVFATDEEGKKKAIILIEKVKGEKAYGKITKGKAEKGMGIIKSAAGSASPTKEKKSRASRNRNPIEEKPFSIGVLIGIGFDSMTVKLADSAGTLVETLYMSGTGFSAKAMIDYNFTSYLGIRLLAGLEDFTVKSSAKTAVCNATTDCRTDIMYITTDAWLRYAFVDTSSFNIWAGVGAGFWMPGSKTTNNIDESSVGTTSAIYLGLGTDIAADEDVYLPVQVDYAILPGSDQVTATAIAIRAGLAYRF